jgi:hypothetical protein
MDEAKGRKQWLATKRQHASRTTTLHPRIPGQRHLDRSRSHRIQFRKALHVKEPQQQVNLTFFINF